LPEDPGDAIVTLLSPDVLPQSPGLELKMVPKMAVVLNLNLPAAVGYEFVTVTTGALNTTGETVELVVTFNVVREIEEGAMLVGVQVMSPPKNGVKVRMSVPPGGAGVAKKLLQSFAPVPLIIPLPMSFPFMGGGVPPAHADTTAEIETSSVVDVPPVNRAGPNLITPVHAPLQWVIPAPTTAGELFAELAAAGSTMTTAISAAPLSIALLIMEPPFISVPRELGV
jgi:hypothetical protein